MTKKEINFINRAKATNKRIVAQYFALYTENSHLNKCLVTFTPADGRLSTLIKIRQEFFKLLNRYKRHPKEGDMTIKYFSNIEFTSKSIPHMHIQLFFTKRDPIKKAYQMMTSSDYQNTHTNSLSFAANNKLLFTYTIKDYLSFDYDLEKFKHHFKGVNFITSSQKSISNSIVRYLFNNLEFKTKNRYKEILQMIQKGLIVISKDKVDISKLKNKYKAKNPNSNKELKVKSVNKVDSKYIYIFERIIVKNKVVKSIHSCNSSDKSFYCKGRYRFKVKRRVFKKRKSKMLALKD